MIQLLTIELIFAGIVGGILGNLIILYWFEKEIPMFFQVEIINKKSSKKALFISLIFTAITYTVIVLLFHLYVSYNSALPLINNLTTIFQNILWLALMAEVFLSSMLFLGGRSLLYGKIVKNLNNAQLKVLSYE